MTKHLADFLFVVGLALAVVGIWMWSPAAAVTFGGFVLMGLSLLTARNGRG